MAETRLDPSDKITLWLKHRRAVAVFSSGVCYQWQPWLDWETNAIKTPENAEKMSFVECVGGMPTQSGIIGAAVKERRDYRSLEEAAFDETLPSVAKYMLQGLIGVPV